MKVHEYRIYGGATQNEEGVAQWPDFMALKLPRAVQLEIIKFLATSLMDEKMEAATINFVGEIIHHPDQSQEELMGPATEAEETSGKPDE